MSRDLPVRVTVCQEHEDGRTCDVTVLVHGHTDFGRVEWARAVREQHPRLVGPEGGWLAIGAWLEIDLD